MGPILLARDHRADDRNHQVRMIHGASTIPPERRPEFEERFGIRLVNGFAMTETGHFSTISPDDPLRYQASGRPVPGFESGSSTTTTRRSRRARSASSASDPPCPTR